MIEAAGLVKRYDGLTVLDDVSITLGRSEIVGVIGGSGSGKTTLLRCLNGLVPFDFGRVFVDGHMLHPLMDVWDTQVVFVRRKVGMVFQHLNLWPYKTTLENIIEGAIQVNHEAPSKARLRARELARQFGIEDQLSKYPEQLSGGQRQRAAIIRAVIMRPEYLLLDEITSALDPVVAGEVVDALLTLRETGLGLLVVSHQIDFIRQKADRVCFLHRGKILESGVASDVLASPKTPELAAFIESVRHGW